MAARAHGRRADAARRAQPRADRARRSTQAVRERARRAARRHRDAGAVQPRRDRRAGGASTGCRRCTRRASSSTPAAWCPTASNYRRPLLPRRGFADRILKGAKPARAADRAAGEVRAVHQPPHRQRRSASIIPARPPAARRLRRSTRRARALARVSRIPAKETSMEMKMVKELLLQSLEHEMGGVKVYETALKCVRERGPEGRVGEVSRGNREARAGFTRRLPAAEPRSRKSRPRAARSRMTSAPALVAAMEAALGTGDKEMAAVRGLRDGDARRDDRPLQLAADRRGGRRR